MHKITVLARFGLRRGRLMADAGGKMRRVTECLWAIVRQRCPRCRTGRMFRGRFTMNDPCPVCNLVFQREEGYFLGAMYASYFLAVAIQIPAFFVFSLLLPEWDSMLVALLVLVLYLPLVPAVFRYARVLWIYLDRAVSPGEQAAGAYEKFRLQQIAETKARSASKDERALEDPPAVLYHEE